MSTQSLVVPDSPGPGAWVDCSGLGPEPLAQLTTGATASDQVRIETAADNNGNIGVIAASTPLVAASPVVVDRPISWMRAVRVSGPTAGLQVKVRTTNASMCGCGGGGGGGAATQPTTANKNMAALTTVNDRDLATNSVVAFTPVGWMGVFVDGVLYVPGDATTEAPCYFSGDGGVTPRTAGSVAAGDHLYWVGSIAGFQLTAGTDVINFLYNITPNSGS